MITEDYVSYEIAKLLKKKGFNEPCLYYYFSNGKTGKIKGLKERNCPSVNTFSIPTHQMAMKWLREVHEIQCVIMYRESGYYEPQIFCLGEWINDKELDGCFSYEEAVEAALKYCLENLI